MWRSKIEAATGAIALTEGLSDRHELLPSQTHDRRRIEALQFGERVADCLAGSCDRRCRIAMRPAGRFRYHGVDDAEAHKVLRGDFHACSRFLRFSCIAPKDGGGAFR